MGHTDHPPLPKFLEKLNEREEGGLYNSDLMGLYEAEQRLLQQYPEAA